MIRFSHFLLTLFCLASLLLAFQGTAHAYADPGSGLLALQIIGSTLAGIGFYFRQKIGKLFIRRRIAAGGPAIKPGSPEDSVESKPE
ncbi:MAG: hypothetical protein WA708_14440 [Acidobacteriaceae bacterium]